VAAAQGTSHAAASGNTTIDDSDSTVWITFTNTLGWSRYEMAMVTSGTADVIITDPSGQPVPYDVLPADQPQEGMAFDLVFPVEVPALGFAVYQITTSSVMLQSDRMASSASSKPGMQGRPATIRSNHRSTSLKRRLSREASEFRTKPLSSSADVVIDNDILQLTISANSGRVAQLLDKRVPKSEPLGTLSLNGDFLNYTGPHLFEGAYIFSPEGTPSPIVPAAATVNVTVEQGKFITRVTQVWSPTVKTVITVFQCHPACSPSSQPALPPSALCTQCGMVHVTSVIGPLYNVTQDIVLRYSMNASSLRSGSGGSDQNPMSSSLLYTVENGLQSIARAYRAGIDEHVSGNYFPMPAAAYLRSAATPNSTYGPFHSSLLAYWPGSFSCNMCGMRCQGPVWLSVQCHHQQSSGRIFSEPGYDRDDAAPLDHHG